MSTLTDLHALSDNINQLPTLGTSLAAQEAAKYLAERAYRERLLSALSELEARIAALESDIGE